MPFYDYECTNHHVFELKQPFTAEPVATCPTCHLPAKRLISLVPVHFKGSGFYVNDYGRKQEASTSKTNGEGKDGKGDANDNKSADTAAKSGSAAKSEDGGKADAAKKEAVKTAISQDKGSSGSSSSSSSSSSTPAAK